MQDLAVIPATISARVCAWLIDCGITVSIIIGLMHWQQGTLDIETYLLNTNYSGVAVVMIVPMLVPIVALLIFSRTAGMFVMDLQLLKADDGLIDWQNVIRRPLGTLALLTTCLLGILAPYFTESGRSLGDLISGTRVIESLALGKRVSYDPWRIFIAILRPLGPVVMALTVAALLLVKGDVANKDVFLDALVIASVTSLFVSVLLTGIKVKVSRVRLSAKGIQRSGWLGWSRKIIPWDEIDHSRIRLARLFPYFEMNKKNRRKFRVPIENNVFQYTGETIASKGIRIEQ